MRTSENLRPFVKILTGSGLKILYGPPLSYKTSLALAYLLIRGGKPSTYVGLGKHCRTAEKLKNFVRAYSILNFKEEVDLLTSLHSHLREREFLAYDGFGATLLPLRSELKESAVIRLAMWIASLLKVAAQTHSASVLVLTTETVKGKPLMFKALSRFSDAFIRVQKDSGVLRLAVQRPDLLETYKITLSTDEITELLLSYEKTQL